MSKYILIAIWLFGVPAVAASTADKAAAEATLRKVIFQQLSARTGVDARESTLDKSETTALAVTTVRKRDDKPTTIASNQVLASNGLVVIKKDEIVNVDFNGTIVFKTGLACSVGSSLQKSVNFKDTSKCKVDAMCIVTKKENGKEKTEDVNISAETNCSIAADGLPPDERPSTQQQSIEMAADNLQ